MATVEIESKIITLIDQSLFFVYCDSRGHIAKFHITNASISGDYLQGIKRPDNKFRTFRTDRILETFPSIESWEKAELVMPDPLPHSTTNKNGLEICFTGFAKAEKAKLIELATNAGMIVRDGVTKKLNLLCYGKNAGPVKVKKAREQGVLALTSSQLEGLILTGEIPSEAGYELPDKPEVRITILN